MSEISLTGRFFESLRGKNRKRTNELSLKKRRALLLECLERREVFAAFTVGDLAVIRANEVDSNAPMSIIEVSSTAGGQTGDADQRIDIGSDFRISGSASSTGYLALTNDGSRLAFANPITTNTTANVNTITTRGVGTVDGNGIFAVAAAYTGATNNQARGATSLDNTAFFIADQGGIHTNGSTAPSPTANVRGVKSFGGSVYVAQASSTAGTNIISTVSAPSGGALTPMPGLTNNSGMQDFYLIQSGSSGSTFDVLYTVFATSNTAGTISKFSLVSGSWVANGTFTTTFGGFGLAAQDNGTSPGATLFVTSGLGALVANNVLRLVDSTGYNETLTLGTSTTLYTAPAGTIVKGISLAPSGGTPAPEVNVRGNSVSIVDGDVTPDVADFTSFPATVIASTSSRSFTIENTGSATLTLSSFSSSNSAFTIAAGAPTSVAPGASATFVVNFTPSSAGTFTSTISFVNDDSDESPYNFDVSGSATATLEPEVNVLGGTISIADGDVTPDVADLTAFPTTVVGQTSTRTYTIQNTGTSNLTLGAFSSTNPLFTIPSPPTAPIVPGGSTTFSVVFAPTAVGAATASIAFVNNDNNENDNNENPYNFDVSGNAITVPSVKINELRISSTPNTLDDLSNNFVELFAAPNTPLTGLTLLVVSSQFAPGQVDFAVDLSGATTDANGFLLIADDGTTAVTESGDVILANFDMFGSPATFFVVSGYTGTLPLDLDTDNVGGLNTILPWTAIVDSVSIDLSAGTSQNYSPTVVLSADGFAPAGVRRLVDGTGSFGILAFADTSLDTPGATNAQIPAVTIVQSGNATIVTEGGATDTLAISLSAAPTSDVTVNFTVNNGQATLSTGSLTFTPTGGANPWNVAQSITVTALDDLVNEGAHSSIISVTTTSTDAAFNNLTVTPVNVSIVDNDGVVLSQLLINEIFINPPDPAGDTGHEYLEFRGTPGATIPGDYYLVSIEGDGGTGTVDQIFTLGGMTIGSNGYLVLRQAGNLYTVDPNSSVVTATGTGWGTTFSNLVNDLENGSNTFMLIRSATAPVPSADVDATGDGVLDGDATSWTIVDSIGIMDGGLTDTAYATINFSATGAGVSGGTIFNLTTFDTVGLDGFTPDYLARLGNTTGQTAADWVASDALGTAPSFTISAVEVTPTGTSGALNHIGATNVFVTPQPAATIANRRVFYNNAPGTNFSSAGAADNAIASDKSALLPGGASTFDNYTNYVRGLNGLIVDINNLPSTTTNSQMLDNLQFASWNGIDVAGFAALPALAIPTAEILPTAGVGGSSRVKITFPDNSLQNTWLRVTVSANTSTGLTANDVFYFGNVIGELNFGNTASRLRVNVADTGLILANQSPGNNSVLINNIYDLNRDGRVNVVDTSFLLANQQPSGIVAPLTVPPPPPVAPMMAASSQSLAAPLPVVPSNDVRTISVNESSRGVEPRKTSSSPLSNRPLVVPNNGSGASSATSVANVNAQASSDTDAAKIESLDKFFASLADTL
jgi:hypothetical protein